MKTHLPKLASSRRVLTFNFFSPFPFLSFPSMEEVDLIHSDNNMKGNDEGSVLQLPYPSSSDGGDNFENPETPPRIGDEYQAQIPPLLLEYYHLTKESSDLDISFDIPNQLLLSIPIPIMWARAAFDNYKKEAAEVLCNQDDAANINGDEKYEKSEDNQITSYNENANRVVECLITALHDGKETGLSNLQRGGVKMDVDILLAENKISQLDRRSKGLYPFPGSLGEAWSDIERDSFLLGVYIFGKNLVLVKKFVESKEMGDILSFYYGEFYRSDRYCRWSEIKKLRGRRSILGQRIFTGGRLQELLSRLVCDVSEECKNKLLEVSRTFEEGKISLEEYVFTLKSAVGISKLIEAVGIGRGKQDLTATPAEPIKNNHIFPLRPEIPIGKACSSLSSGDIIKFLTGNFRLSKARSNDLFWEAVWPRLLARGWHSEQPKDHGVSGLKYHLVFLTPGIKKFSRRRLKKGEHYFDSVSDVLNKVASNPGLLELETEAAEGSRDKEQWSDPQIKQNLDGSSNGKHRSYLKPHKSNGNGDLKKFTIVDTSLYDGKEGSKVRVMRSLTIATENVFSPSRVSSKTEDDTSEELEVEGEEIKTAIRLEAVTDRRASADSSECVTSILNSSTLIAPDPTIVPVENHEGQSAGVYNDKKSGKKRKHHQLSRNMKYGRSSYLAPVSRQQSTAYGLEDSNHGIENMSTDSKLYNENIHCRSNLPDADVNVGYHVGPSEHVSSASSSAKGSPERRNEDDFCGSCPVPEKSPEKRQLHTLIDLNAPPDSGSDEPAIMDMVHKQDDLYESSQPETSQQPEPLKLSDVGTQQQQQQQEPVLNGRRQSTRNRPLTTKALEALECGFLNTKKKRKHVESLPQNNSMSRPYRKGRERSGVSSFDDDVGNNIANSRIDNAGLDGIFTNNTRMVDESQV